MSPLPPVPWEAWLDPPDWRDRGGDCASAGGGKLPALWHAVNTGEMERFACTRVKDLSTFVLFVIDLVTKRDFKAWAQYGFRT